MARSSGATRYADSQAPPRMSAFGRKQTFAVRPVQGCHFETALGVAADRPPASAYDNWLAARITLLACFSNFALVRREVGPEMHIDPSSRQFSANTGAATLDTSASRSPNEIWKPRSRMDS